MELKNLQHIKQCVQSYAKLMGTVLFLYIPIALIEYGYLIIMGVLWPKFPVVLHIFMVRNRSDDIHTLSIAGIKDTQEVICTSILSKSFQRT